MARLSVIVRDKKREKLREIYGERRAELKKKGDWTALDKLPKNSSPVRAKNRCALTGRPKGYMRKFGICRVVFREMANYGQIPGVKKASW